MFEFASIQTEKEGESNIADLDVVEIKYLSFRFAGRSQLLKNINMRIAKGEFVLLLGKAEAAKVLWGKFYRNFMVLKMEK